MGSSVTTWHTLFMTKPYARWWTALFAFHVVGVANWLWGPLRSSWSAFNHSFMLAVLAVPLALAAGLPMIRNVWARVGFGVFLIPWILASTILALGTVTVLTNVVRTGVDPIFEFLNSTPIRGCRLAVYRTNLGATTAYGIVVRQEMTVVPGLLVVKRVYAFPGSEAQVSPVGEDAVSISSPDTVAATIQVKRHVFF